MFKLVNKHRKAVSPVIAVVLLIALTVAAGAVIWVAVNNYLQVDATLTFKSDSGTITNSTSATWTGIIDASVAGKITAVTVSQSGASVTSFPTSLIKGDNDVTLLLSGITAGDVVLTFSFTPDDGSNPIVAKITTTFA